MPAGRMPPPESEMEADRTDALVLGHIARYPGLNAHPIGRALRITYGAKGKVDTVKVDYALARLSAAGLITGSWAVIEGRTRRTWRLA